MKMKLQIHALKSINMIKTEIAILIPVHNGLNYTAECLSSLYGILDQTNETREKFRIIVIDDGSTDGSSGWIETNFPRTIIIRGDGNLWWSGGINKGITCALGELACNYVLWWNNDIHCAEDYFSRLLEIIDQTSSDTIIGSKIYCADEPQKIWAFGGTFNTHSGQKNAFAMDETDSDQFQQVKEVDWLPGMGTTIHKSVFEKIGNVNQHDFPQYHGDSDFTFRAKLAGYHNRVYPLLQIWNDKSNSGLRHYNSFRLLIRSLGDIKSNYHIGKDILFYRRYISSPIAYKTLLSKYYLYIGGFIKWKVLNLIGIRKKKSIEKKL